MKDTNQDLFDTWVHPVLDLSGIRLKDLPEVVNPDSVYDYLRATVTELVNQVLHDAAEKIMRTAREKYGSGIGMLAAAHLIHPEHDGECDA